MYIVLGVEECSDVPVLCKRAYDNVLRDGVCDVRTRRKLEPSEIPTQANMPDLLALVTDKGSDSISRANRMFGSDCESSG